MKQILFTFLIILAGLSSCNHRREQNVEAEELITQEFYENSKETALDYYLKFVDKGADTSVFEIPEYNY